MHARLSPLDAATYPYDGWKLNISNSAVTGKISGDAVMVEPRIIIGKYRAIHSMKHMVLPLQWSVHLVTKRSGETHPSLKNVVIHNVLEENYHRSPCRSQRRWLCGKMWYNRWLVNTTNLRRFTGELLLVFEADFLFCKQPALQLSDFAADIMRNEYMFIGAPWERDGECRRRMSMLPTRPPSMRHCVGNGGFSLMRRTQIIEVFDHFPANSTEFLWDFYASRVIQWSGGFVASPTRASYFSIESGKVVPKLGPPLAIHKAMLLDKSFSKKCSDFF